MSELKVALVTGGSRGIGKACVLALAEEESIGTVVFTSRNAAKGDQIQDELQKEVGDKAKSELCSCSFLTSSVYHRELNLDSPALTESGMDKLLQDFPRIDILVNNAGVFQDWGVSAFEASTETVRNCQFLNSNLGFKHLPC